MPLKKIEKDELVYLVYRRDSHNDFEDLRKQLEIFTTDTTMVLKDIAIDFSASQRIYDGEMNCIIAVVKRFYGTNRHVRIVAQKSIVEKLKELRLTKAGNLLLYETHGEFLKDLNIK
jgi:hypothetical protein